MLDQCRIFRPGYADQILPDQIRQVTAAQRAGYDKAITFEFSHFMSPQSAYLQAGHLYNRYKEYFDIK